MPPAPSFARPQSILITGASSGIGAALALAYAAPGVTLVLGGRSAERLADVASACRAKGATVETAAIDVTDLAATEAWVLAADTARPLDLVVANAGVSAGTGHGEEPMDQVRRIMAVNVDGALNAVLPILPRMVARGHGQVALVASLAGYRGMPGAPAYCASKAAIKVYGEALRGDMGLKGVGISVICPGYVDTAMTRVNRFRMPFLMTVDRAALVIRRGLARNRARIAFPWPLHAAMWLAAALPPAWLDPLLIRLPRKI